MTPADTRDRLLDAAERHFADHGFAGAGLREITADAGANLAAVSYHFGSKEELFVAVVARVMAPINAERLRLLDAAEASAAGRPLEIEALIEIVVGPVLRARAESASACSMRVFARFQHEDAELWKRLAEGPLKVIKPRIEAALSRALPSLAPAEIAYRMHFMMGAVKSVAADQHALRAFSGGLCDPGDVERTLRELVRFLAAGMCAPGAKAAARARRAGNNPRPRRAKESKG